MNSTSAKELAASMIIHHGKAQAYSLAVRYAGEFAAEGDSEWHDKWAAAAAVIGELIEADQQFGKLIQHLCPE
jgi:hypothetical protein